MGFRERVNAARAAKRDQAAAAEKEVADKRAAWNRRVEEHRRKAILLMPEVEEAVGLLRSKRKRSFEVLNEPKGAVEVLWADRDGPLKGPPGQGSSRKAKRRWKRREPTGWEVRTATSSRRGTSWKPGNTADAIVIPLQGQLRVVDAKAAGTLDEHVQHALWRFTEHLNKEDGSVVREIHADKTVLSLLERLADHLAELDEACDARLSAGPGSRARQGGA